MMVSLVEPVDRRPKSLTTVISSYIVYVNTVSQKSHALQILKKFCTHTKWLGVFQ